jgi:SAM-dependent methyltransferase
MLPTGVVDLQTEIYNFWKNNSLANIKPEIGEEFPEGWNVIEFFKNFMTPENYGETIEIGCGYGRLCEAFDSRAYLGLDISPIAIKQAIALNPLYDFKLITEDTLNKFYPHSRTKLLYTVLLHQSDEDIKEAVENLCATSRRIIVAEICGRDWRREGNPPVFNRNAEEYINMFQDYGRGISTIIKKPYIRYKDWNKLDTDLTIMVFED